MDAPRFLLPGGGTDTPGGYVRLALLAALLTVTSLGGAFLAVYRPLPVHRVPLDLVACAAAPAGAHRIDIEANGRIVLDGGRRGDLVALRMQLERASVAADRVVALRPDPELRYERFLEIYAATQRAGIRRIRLACAEADDAA